MYTDPARTYRGRLIPKPGETAFQAVVEQTDLWIVAEKDLSAQVVSHVEAVRGRLKNYILLHPEFAESLTPVEVCKGAPEIAARMALAAKAAGVGPMAAVAGAMSQSVVERFAGESPNILVENGGDIFMHSTRDRVIGLLARPIEGVRLGLSLPASGFPLAVCASSGRVGHSLSLGRADLVTVLGRAGAMADAAATALANMVRSKDDLEPMLTAARKLKKHGITGVFAQWGETVAAWGELEIVALE